jgi:hypothetical protein
MKYVILESRLNEFITDYLNTFIESVVVSDLYPYLIISPKTEEWEDDIPDYMEYDHSDGRLWIEKNFLRSFVDLFAFNKENAEKFIKEWFEKRFGVKIEYVFSSNWGN